MANSTPSEKENPSFWIVTVFAATLGIWGLYLPWITISTPYYNFSRNGIDWNGQIVLLLYLFAICIILINRFIYTETVDSRSQFRLEMSSNLLFLIGIGIICIVFYDYSQINDVENFLGGYGNAYPFIGVGILLSVVAATGLIVSALDGLNHQTEKNKTKNQVSLPLPDPYAINNLSEFSGRIVWRMDRKK
jgi:hypothetical protein